MALIRYLMFVISLSSLLKFLLISKFLKLFFKFFPKVGKLMNLDGSDFKLVTLRGESSGFI